mgnify:CR=1 FL=1
MRISTAAVVDTPEIAIHTVQMFESIKLLLNLDPHTSPLRTIQEANRRLNLPAAGRFRQQAIEVLQFVLTAATYYNAPSQSRVGRISTGVLVQRLVLRVQDTGGQPVFLQILELLTKLAAESHPFAALSCDAVRDRCRRRQCVRESAPSEG